MNSSSNQIPLSLYSYQLAKPLNQVVEKLPAIAWKVCEMFSGSESRFARAQLNGLLPKTEEQDAILGILLGMGILKSDNVSYVDYIQNPIGLKKESATKEISAPISAFEPSKEAFAGVDASEAKPTAAAVNVAEAFADNEIIAVQLDEEEGGSFMID